MFKRAIFFTLIILANLQAQTYNFDTHSSTLKGELTKDDIFENDFGRFDAYELQMEEGDFIIMKLKADFFPLMTVVSPSSEYKIAFPNDSNPEVVFKQEIDETGLWQIFIAGDSTDVGNHSLKLCYVSQITRELPADATNCDLLNFFLAHSETNFFYFYKNNLEFKSGKVDLEIDSHELFDKSELEKDENKSKVTLHFNNNDYSFETISEELKKCLKGDWNKRESENKIEFSEIEGLRKISILQNKLGIELSISTK